MALDEAVVKRYAKMTGEDAKNLIVHDKWLARIALDVAAEVDRVGQALTGRVKVLTERYAAPMPKLADDAEMLAARVDAHLKRMGFAA